MKAKRLADRKNQNRSWGGGNAALIFYGSKRRERLVGRGRATDTGATASDMPAPTSTAVNALGSLSVASDRQIRQSIFELWVGRLGMELKSFIQQAIVEIVQGVEGAQKELGATYTIGNTNHNYLPAPAAGIMQDGNGFVYSVVSFDVAVTTTDEASGGGGISVIGIGAKGEVSVRAETASRVSFSTTVRLG